MQNYASHVNVTLTLAVLDNFNVKNSKGRSCRKERSLICVQFRAVIYNVVRNAFWRNNLHWLWQSNLYFCHNNKRKSGNLICSWLYTRQKELFTLVNLRDHVLIYLFNKYNNFDDVRTFFSTIFFVNTVHYLLQFYSFFYFSSGNMCWFMSCKRFVIAIIFRLLIYTYLWYLSS